MENETENNDSTNVETDELELETPNEGDEPTERETALIEKNKHLFARAKKAEGFVLKDGKWNKPVKVEAKPTEVEKPKATGELDDTQLDYLDLKGITADEDIEVIQKIMSKTGQTVREALKDDYVISKLKALKAERDVKNATPSSTKRSGGQVNNLDYWINKYDQTGELPPDFETRSAVVNAKEKALSASVPTWRR